MSTVFEAELPAHHTLIERGPCRLVRRLKAMGVILAAVGRLLAFSAWAIVMFFPLSSVVIARARREEVALTSRHGQAWETYARKVAACFPRTR